MTQVYKDKAPTPKQAFRRRSAIDSLLDPEKLKALAEPTRAKLLSCLLKCGRACSVTEVAACCDLDFSTVARHLSLMARSGLLSADKKGRTVWYSADGAQLAGYFRDIAEAIEDVQPGGCCDETDSKAGCQSKSKGCA
ncbi:MAG: ArsR/SmtB family transcription factor [Phycisphaerales bacterium]